jgi:hypothetical protein
MPALRRELPGDGCGHGMTRLPDFGGGSAAMRRTRRLAFTAAGVFAGVILAAVIWAIAS